MMSVSFCHTAMNRILYSSVIVHGSVVMFCLFFILFFVFSFLGASLGGLWMASHWVISKHLTLHI